MSGQYRLFVRAPLLAIIILVCSMGIFARRGFLDWRRMVRQTESLTERISATREQRNHLSWKIEQLQKSPDEQERVVRQLLGYIRPNEMVIEFP